MSHYREHPVTDLDLAAFLYLDHPLLRLDTDPHGRRLFVFAHVAPDEVRGFYRGTATVQTAMHARSLRAVRGMIRGPRAR